jgi:hypothetical protein
MRDMASRAAAEAVRHRERVLQHHARCEAAAVEAPANL